MFKQVKHMDNKILIVKNEQAIMISNNGKRLVIDIENKLFEELKSLTKDEILKWYLSRK